MNRMIRLMSGVLLVAAVAACNNDPSLDLNGEVGEPTKVQATPQIMFINQGATKTVYLRLTDNANFATPVGPYTVSDVGPGLTVAWDSTYRPDYIPGTLTNNPIQTQHRYTVKADQNVKTSFKVTNKGITQELTVTVVQTTLGAALSSTAPAIGDLVTITAPQNLLFDVDKSEVTFADAGGDPIVTAITPTSITFLPMPGSKGPATVTNVSNTYSPEVGAKTLTTTNSVDVPSPAVLTLSDTMPAIGQNVTVTAGTGEAFAPDATVTFADGGGDAVIVSQNATTITFIPIPGSEGPATITGVLLTPGESALFDPFTLRTSNSIEVPAVLSLPLTFSTATPGPGVPVTISATGFVFEDGLAVSIGGTDAFVISVAADGLSASILPPAGMTAETASVSNVHLASLPAVTLANVPSVATITSSAVYAATPGGGTSLATAASLTNPVTTTMGAFLAETGTLNYGPQVDYLGGGNAGVPRYYKFVVAEAGTYDITMSWNGGGDMDMYIRDAADADVASSTSGSNPEHVSKALTPGTYYIVLHNWHALGPVPTQVLVTVK